MFFPASEFWQIWEETQSRRDAWTWLGKLYYVNLFRNLILKKSNILNTLLNWKLHESSKSNSNISFLNVLNKPKPLFVRTFKLQLSLTVQFISSFKNNWTRPVFEIKVLCSIFFGLIPKTNAIYLISWKSLNSSSNHLCMKIQTKDCNSFQSLYQRFHWEENTGKAIIKQPSTFSLLKVRTRSGHKLWYSYKDIWRRKIFPS